jgi:large subunit ribosomal protein L24
MPKSHLKRGDQVVVIAGSQRGKEGKILEVLAEKGRARVEGLAMMKRHTRKSEQAPQGAIIEREGSIHMSNLMLKTRHDERKSRRGAPASTPAKTKA